ncbi:hypothetical protein ACIOJE_12395 [Kitasatospora sp. NPDC087861]|uniref:hypothetical protein n=1 Tax=Kitasatospora sp. NPDC087861 TaxID=3364070 RepID=UPI003800EF15
MPARTQRSTFTAVSAALALCTAAVVTGCAADGAGKPTAAVTGAGALSSGAASTATPADGTGVATPTAAPAPSTGAATATAATPATPGAGDRTGRAAPSRVIGWDAYSQVIR